MNTGQRFVYTVSHDSRSPLVTISGFAARLRDDLSKNIFDHMNDDIERIVKTAGNMSQLLDDLLKISRIGRVIEAQTVFPIQEIVDEVLEDLQEKINLCAISFEYSSTPEVLGDKRRIKEVMQNLLENAVKYSNKV